MIRNYNMFWGTLSIWWICGLFVQWIACNCIPNIDLPSIHLRIVFCHSSIATSFHRSTLLLLPLSLLICWLYHCLKPLPIGSLSGCWCPAGQLEGYFFDLCKKEEAWKQTTGWVRFWRTQMSYNIGLRKERLLMWLLTGISGCLPHEGSSSPASGYYLTNSTINLCDAVRYQSRQRVHDKGDKEDNDNNTGNTHGPLACYFW